MKLKNVRKTAGCPQNIYIHKIIYTQFFLQLTSTINLLPPPPSHFKVNFCQLLQTPPPLPPPFLVDVNCERSLIARTRDQLTISGPEFKSEKQYKNRSYYPESKGNYSPGCVLANCFSIKSYTFSEALVVFSKYNIISLNSFLVLNRINRPVEVKAMSVQLTST